MNRKTFSSMCLALILAPGLMAQVPVPPRPVAARTNLVVPTNGPARVAATNQTASKQLRRALVGRGLEILPGELTVLEQRGQQLKCAFVFGPVGLPVEI